MTWQNGNSYCVTKPAIGHRLEVGVRSDGGWWWRV